MQNTVAVNFSLQKGNIKRLKIKTDELDTIKLNQRTPIAKEYLNSSQGGKKAQVTFRAKVLKLQVASQSLGKLVKTHWKCIFKNSHC